MRAPRSLADAIDAVLPQTQCTKCGYAGCRPYAEAIASGEASINRCPPGGDAGIHALASITGQPWQPLDPTRGTEGPVRLAWIDERRCIGCTLCIQACPVDAIVGAPKRMHTVIPELCTGCDLCVPPCPVDCIEMRLPVPAISWDRERAADARRRFEARRTRLERQRDERAAREDRAAAPTAIDASTRRAAVAAALERARARRSGGKGRSTP